MTSTGMIYLANRENSFKNPLNTILARSGFYCTDKKDTVKCFACDVSSSIQNSNIQHDSRCAASWLSIPDKNKTLPVHLNYVSVESREDTLFLRWPGQQCDREMAECGFFYSGEVSFVTIPSPSLSCCKRIFT